MRNYTYNFSISLDSEQYRTLNRAISLFRVASAIMDYGDNIEECEVIQNKIEDKLEVITNNT